MKARIMPAFFSMIIPIMVFNHFYVSEEFSRFVGGVLGAKLVSNISISMICLYFLSEIGRMLSKNIFQRFYFKEELYMPTTNYLMFSDKTYSQQHKIKIRNKIFSDFRINLSTADEESADEHDARTKIVETMALIRKKLMGNKFLLQHNIEYGAMRNVIGGSVLGILLSIFNLIFFSLVIKINLAYYISIATLGIYFLLVIFSKIIIDFYGNNYAKILFREYLGNSKGSTTNKTV
ncbi:hypothetical protein [Methylomonas koyamae]|nr:hypothetical protein [Methylomonas koyamae]